MSNDSIKIPPDENDANRNRLIELNNAIHADETSDTDPLYDFDEDAAEGLQQIKEHKISGLVAQINSNLSSQLKNKKRIRPKITDQTMVIVTVITILILIILSFIVIKQLQ